MTCHAPHLTLSWRFDLTFVVLCVFAAALYLRRSRRGVVKPADPYEHRTGFSLSSLVGERIDSAAMVPGEAIYLMLASGETVQLCPWGDFCSHCFVADVSGAEFLIGAEVTAVEDLEMRDISSEAGEVTEVWGHRIVTSQGICTIGMRLERNGYYSGHLEVSIAPVPTTAKPLEDFTS